MQALRDLCLTRACSRAHRQGPASAGVPLATTGVPSRGWASQAQGLLGQQRTCSQPTHAVPVNFSGSHREHNVWGGPQNWDRMKVLMPERRQALQEAVHLYYQEVWNSGTTDALDSLADDGVVYCDVLGGTCDCFGRKGLRQLIGDFLAGHPLVKVTLDETLVDEEGGTVVAHWHATAANLLPGRDGAPASGRVSEVSGSDTFRFSESGRITSIQSFRGRFAGEEEEGVEPADYWDGF